MAPPRKQGLASLAQAFDELSFGPSRILNLRAHLPTRAQAVARCESWLREQQAGGVREVLVITGRGERSVDGVSVVRQGVLDLLSSLSRRHVVAGYREHTAGSFVVDLQPFAAVHASRANAPAPAPAPADPRTLAALAAETRDALRTLAVTHMQALGAHSPTRRMVEAEMLAWFEKLSATVIAREPARPAPARDAPTPPRAGRARPPRPSGARDVPGDANREAALRRAIQDALEAIGA
ncbi:hypothetical protein tb265_14230 [Gemmatimonadetes bacterium T265]|nr:hypothetical protein tb265_14230 [Gemmatimonadetes bacterium T265]